MPTVIFFSLKYDDVTLKTIFYIKTITVGCIYFMLNKTTEEIEN